MKGRGNGGNRGNGEMEEMEEIEEIDALALQPSVSYHLPSVFLERSKSASGGYSARRRKLDKAGEPGAWAIYSPCDKWASVRRGSGGSD
jgi:hypothetical protein